MIAIVSDCDDCAHGVELGLPSNSDSDNLKKTRAIVKGLFKEWSS